MMKNKNRNRFSLARCVPVKFAAVVLSLICVWLGVATGLDMLSVVYESNYFFEENYEDSDFLYSNYSTLSNESEQILSGILLDKYPATMFKYDSESASEFFRNDDVEPAMIISELDSTFAKCKIEYYVSLDGIVFSNTTDMTEADFSSHHYAICHSLKDGIIRETTYGTLCKNPFRIYTGNRFENWLTNNSKTDNVVEAVPDFPIDTPFDYGEEFHGETTTQPEPVLQNAKFYVRYSSEKQTELSDTWHLAAKMVIELAKRVLSYACVILVLFVYLMWICGHKNYVRNDDIETPVQVYHTNVYDRLFVEINLAIFALICIGAVAIVFIVGDDFGFVNSLNKSFVFPALSTLAVCVWAAVLGCLCSLMRNIKAKMFLKRSLAFVCLKYGVKLLRAVIKKLFDFVCAAVKLLVKVLSAMGEMFSSMFRALRIMLSRKVYAFAVGAFALYSVFMFILFLVIANGRYWQQSPAVFAVLVIFSIGCAMIVRTVSRFELLRRGIAAIKSGNTELVINGCGDGLIGEMASDVNTIGDGLRASLERQMKAERMKAELITNVSHDLKTPLTSIVNYTKLLCEMELSPGEANDYVKIIASKSDRLKTLTNDLFDVSKAQSGNENVCLESLDIALLAKQMAAEHERALCESEIDLRLCVPDSEVKILADGKKLSRVFDNLLVNIEKYSLKGTRAYFEVSATDNKVCCELKNISAYPLDFDPNEITERFVRGEKSRSAEGNGLGLAIAKSYTELCGGSFKIKTDGDLFKAVIEFPIL